MASQVDIAPALGHGVVSLQDPSVGWDAIDDRRRASVGRQEGAVEAGSYKVTPGSLMTVEVAADAGPYLVQGDSVAHQGLYHVAPVIAPLVLDVPDADPSLPRFDRIILEVKDATFDGSGLSLARVRYVAGTPASGADLDTPAGAPTVPDSAALLAEHVVPAGSSSVDAANIRDRRAWAFGVRAKQDTVGADLATNTANTWKALDRAIRVECSGKPVKVGVGVSFQSTNINEFMSIGLFVDGAWVAHRSEFPSEANGLGGHVHRLDWEFDYEPTPGSHLFELKYQFNGTNTGKIFRAAQSVGVQPDTWAPLIMRVEEDLRPRTDNG